MRFIARCMALAAMVLLAGPAQSRPQRQPVPAGDFHQHLFSERIVALAGPASALTPLDAQGLVRLLDAAGIGKAVLLSTAYMFGSPARRVDGEYARVREENDWTAAQAARFPDRLIAFRRYLRVF